MTRIVWQGAFATLALTLVQAMAGVVLVRGPDQVAPGLGWVLLANALTAVLAVVLAERMAGRTWVRAGALLVVLFGIQAASLVEAVFFGLDIPGEGVPRLFAFSLVTSALFALAVGVLVRPFPGPAPARRARGRWSWAGRLVASDLAYVVAYFVAGMLIIPYVQSFYATRKLPGPLALLSMQVVRGLVFTALVVLLVRTVRGSRRGVAALAGATLSIVGGISPLLLPNPYLPDAVRLVHLGEVGVSNFLFGLLAGWLLGSPAASVTPAGEPLDPLVVAELAEKPR